MSEPPAPHGVTRRDFLGVAAAGIAAALPGPAGRALRAAPPGVPDDAAPPPPFELAELGIAELREGLERGRWTSERLVELYLERIAALDRQGPALRAMITTNPDAPALAAALDRERRERGARGPLHGIPVLVKDNLATADRQATTAGSLALEGVIAPEDAHVVARLREAGAVLLGKTNLSEWANFRSTRSSSGWSAVGGQCRNPYVLDRSPCGSSSGSAAAVAANYAPVAIGTETDGSIVCPSATCGLVGIKPTVGLVSRRGIVPISRTQDTAGPMCRTVRDAAVLLAAITGEDPRDPATAGGRTHLRADWGAALVADGLRGARIGVVRNAGRFSSEVMTLFEAALDTLRRLGATVVDPADIRTLGKFDDDEFEVLLHEFKEDLNRYFRWLGPQAPVKSLAELIAFNERERAREMPWFGQEILEMAQARGGLAAPKYREALARCGRLSRAEGIDATLARHRVEALVAPTGGPAWTIDLVNGDHFGGGSSTAPAVAGYPNITVPMGDVQGLPVGLSFIGPAWSEFTLLRLAYSYEQATTLRRPPGFRGTVEG